MRGRVDYLHNLLGVSEVSLSVVPLTLDEVNELIKTLHRHHKPVVGHRFSLGAKNNDVLVGGCVVGRPVARKTCQKTIAEVTRLVTDGTKNACSFLYAAAARVAREMGFKKIQTFILEEESGVSLEAAGWVLDGLSEGGDWTSKSKPNRRQDQPQGRKKRYVKCLR